MRFDRFLDKNILKTVFYSLIPHPLIIHSISMRDVRLGMLECLKLKLILFSTENNILIQQTLVYVNLYMWIFPVNSQG